ncbi:MAG: hypothetical protein ACRD3C_17470 [Vicinamibacterales bacterium]
MALAPGSRVGPYEVIAPLGEGGMGKVWQSFPEPTVKVQVSARGGTLPYWRRDGRELFYAASDERIMAVPIDLSATTARPGAPVALFQSSGSGGRHQTGSGF